MAGRRAPHLLALCAAAACAAAPATAGGDARGCRLSGSTLEAASKRAAVYRRGDRLYGCLRGRARRVDLASGDSVAYPRPALRLRGTLVAYAVDVYDGASEQTQVIVRDLRRPLDPSVVALTSQGVRAVRLVDRETVVWMVCTAGSNASAEKARCRDPGIVSTVEVYRHDRQTPEHGADRLDEGEGISVRSLRVRERRAYWRNAGELRSAALR